MRPGPFYLTGIVLLIVRWVFWGGVLIGLLWVATYFA